MGVVACSAKFLFHISGNLETFDDYRNTNIAGVLVVLAGIPFAILATRKNVYKGAIGFGDGVKEGIKSTLIAALMICFFTYIYLKYMEPDLVESFVEQYKLQMDEKNIDEENLKKGEEFVRALYSPFKQSTLALIFTLFPGVLVSLISAGFLRTR